MKTNAFDKWGAVPDHSLPLNGIAKARQLALLIMYVYEQEGVIFEPFEVFENEQDFYAQAIDERFPFPDHAGTSILKAMGLTNPTKLRDYLQILRIPKHFWLYADDHNLTESEIARAQATDYELPAHASITFRSLEFEYRCKNLMEILSNAKTEEQRDMALSLINEFQHLIQNLDERS